MADKKNTWLKAANAESEIKLRANGIGVLEADGKKICVGKFKNQWVAFAYNCPHAGGIMAEGYIDANGNVVCPQHSYKFSLKNGWSRIPEGFCLKVYAVESRNDGFFIGIEEIL